MPEHHRAMFEEYCYDCHDTFAEEGGVDLEKLSFNISEDLENAALWQKVLDVLNSKEMPPEEELQIAPDVKTAFLDDLSNQLVSARDILGDSGGVITLRRLNRREYQNTIEDLLGIRPDVSELPDDQTVAGFDTQGASLFFSSDQLEKYHAVARNSLQLALTSKKKPQSKTYRIEPEDTFFKTYAKKAHEFKEAAERAIAWQSQSKKPSTEFGFIDDHDADEALGWYHKFFPQLADYLKRPENQNGTSLISTIKQGITRVKTPTQYQKLGGKYLLRVKAGTYKGASDRLSYLEFTSKVEKSDSQDYLGWRKVNGTLKNPEIIEFPIELEAGKRTSFYVHQRTHMGRGDKNIWSKVRAENGIGPAPGIWIDWIELEGPIHDTWPPEAVSKLLFERPKGWSDTEYANEVIERFADRAFRSQSPSPEFVSKLQGRYLQKRDAGLSFIDALIDPLSIILTAPSFVYMVEPAVAEGEDDSLTGSELAVRLAYFIWSSPPDEELMESGESGRLLEADELRYQTERLLEDPRSARFVQSFAHQFFEMERLDNFEFKALNFPTFDNAAKESARQEIFQTLQVMLDEELPLKTLLKSDFIMANDVLAEYYGIEGVTGPEFRKVAVSAKSPRGGMLGSAAVMAMGSDGNRSSPVERGAWVLRHLLDDAPPPAPANVPQLDRLFGTPLSSRDLQKAHMIEPQCAQCHRKIDPIGYGLQNFDAAGGWRKMETVTASKGGGKRVTRSFKIDPHGQLPDGTKFKNFYGLRDAVAQNEKEFARGISKALISYGLGRPYGFTDRDLASQIVRKGRSSGYTFNSLIHALIQSDPFQTK
ncbi:DUF1592 domain-containing protein [Pelagicoccus mobilis]|uniref:DUF1592 domain-containing protein n=1 Tax=Pelagicoccus mobilis TaxID=415221 RepID=A0A934S6V4_9BACT|nr:DUF1592 domain-containing protein [Pelagicoccus mobilis]MBK1880023.1 DUF1592 domain-containing protein [Pelagicoccus mobilis]